VLEHRARDDLPGPLALQPEPRDEPVERGREHVLVGRFGVRPVGTGEGDPVAPEDRDLFCHYVRTSPFI
jgi:hypothetical protein